MADANRVFISIDPDDATSGGLLNDITVEWKSVKAAMYDYGGKVHPPIPALCITMADAESGEEFGEQYYKAGNSDAMAASEDGKGFVALRPGIMGLNNKTRMFQLVQSLRNAGFPKEKMADVAQDLTVLGGLVCHMVQEPALSKPLTAKKRADGSEYDSTVLVVESIKRLPWEGKAAPATAAPKRPASAGGGKKAAAPPAKAVADASDELDSKCVQFVMGLLAERGGEVMKKDLPTEAFKSLKDDPDRIQVVKIVFDDEWLSTDKPWAYSDGVVRM